MTLTTSRPKRLPPWMRTLKESGLVYGLAALFLAAGIWIAFLFVEPAPPRGLSIATGSTDGAYLGFGEDLKQELALDDVEMNVIETNGSVDNLQKLHNGEVDVAFLQSGLASADEYPDLLSLGSVYFEPVWIFTRKGLVVDRLNELAGARIAVGGAGSGSRIVAKRLLESNRLDGTQVELLDESGSSAIALLEVGEIDALVSVASVNAVMIQALLASTKVELVSLSRAAAYARREPWLTHLTLPEGVIDLNRNVPSATVNLLAVNATLVTSSKLHPALRELLVRGADTVFSHSTVLSRVGEFPSAIGSEFPLASAAARYYESGPPFLQRFFPFWVANIIDRLKLLALPLLALLLPLSRMLPPAYRWTVRKKIYRWYEEVQTLDQSAFDDRAENNLQRCLSELYRIEDEVRDVEVPLGYAHELYVLRQHIELLQQQIEQRWAKLAI